METLMGNYEFNFISVNDSDLYLVNFILNGDENRTLILGKNSLLHLDNISFRLFFLNNIKNKISFRNSIVGNFINAEYCRLELYNLTLENVTIANTNLGFCILKFFFIILIENLNIMNIRSNDKDFLFFQNCSFEDGQIKISNLKFVFFQSGKASK